MLDVRAVPRSGIMGPGKFACPREPSRRGHPMPLLRLTRYTECWSCGSALNAHAFDGNCPGSPPHQDKEELTAEV